MQKQKCKSKINMKDQGSMALQKLSISSGQTQRHRILQTTMVKTDVNQQVTRKLKTIQ